MVMENVLLARQVLAVIPSCVSPPAAGASCWSSFASQLRECQDAAVSGKTQAGFSEGSRDLAGGREADSISAALSLLQRPLSPSRAADSRPVREMCLSSPWCLAGLAHSEITGLVGLGRQGFGMRLDGPLGLHPSYVMQGQSLGGCPMSQLLDSAALHGFPHAQ